MTAKVERKMLARIRILKIDMRITFVAVTNVAVNLNVVISINQTHVFVDLIGPLVVVCSQIINCGNLINKLPIILTV